MSNRRPRQRGMALMIVVTMLAVASVLGMAMLSSSALQAQMSDALPRIAQAEYLAESGIHWGIAKLRADAMSDEFVADEPGAYASRTYGPMALRSPGQCTITIRRDEQRGTWNDFVIESRAVLHNADGEVIAQADRRAEVKATAELRFPRALICEDDVLLTANTTVMRFSSIASKGKIDLRNDHQMLPGGVMFGNPAVDQRLPSAQKQPFSASQVALDDMGMIRPTLPKVRNYRRYVWHDGRTYEAQPLPVDNGVCANRTLRRHATLNPAGIFYHSGNLQLGDGVDLEGTLVVEGGSLTLAGTGGGPLNYASRIDATKSHSAGFPALVVGGAIDYRNGAFNSRLLRVRGVTWCVGPIGHKNRGNSSEVLFQGAVVCTYGQPNTKGRIDFEYDNDNTEVPTIDTSLESIITVRAWTAQP